MSDDLDAVDRLLAEADDAPHVFPWREQEFAIPRSNRWPAEAIALINAGEFPEAFRLILLDPTVDEDEHKTNADTWRRLSDQRPKVAHYKAIVAKVMRDEGLTDAGNSSGSDDSSRSTPTPSRPTSRGTTRARASAK